MKKSVMIIFIFAFLLIGLNFGSALLEGEKETVDSAYTCLRQTIEDRSCSTLSIEEQIFSLITVEKCKDEVMAAQFNGECWASSKTTNCDLKTTALATLGLNRVNENTEAPELWMLGQAKNATNIQWFFEIDSPVKTTCDLEYDGTTYTAVSYDRNNEKLISMSAQKCLQINSPYAHWLEVDRSCYEKEFSTTCDENFITTLMFKNPAYPTLYVTGITHSSSAGGTTIEQISSLCFANSAGQCDYEGSLWASWVLDSLEHDITKFLPYLIVREPDFPELMPEVFLYTLTGKLEYRTTILSGQINKEYWKKDQNKFYDTALALLPFQEGNLTEKINTKLALIEDQGPDGCWDNKNVLTNAFILYSIWPNQLGGTGTIKDDDTCEEVGYYCVSSNYVCVQSGGITQGNYKCVSNSKRCCSVPEKVVLCSEIQGELCATNEYCQGGNSQNTNDATGGKICCVQGSCQKKVVNQNTCETEAFGICEPYSCAKGYESSNSYSCNSGDICCIKESNKSYWWLWLLFGLIVIVTLAILFRDKIQDLLGGNKKVVPKNPRAPPSYNRRPTMPPQRKMMPSQRRPPMRKPMPQKAPRELDDVLDKLKKMSKK
ncbi:MAG: hypothetical protein U9Q99_00310 [Nanoarchaeota archaeon]|nr:hypothetical protein [Nanoarchaeota archaeon]